MPIVFLVDDEADQRESLRRLLIQEGYDLHLAESGEIALALARNQPPDVVVLDVQMPGLGGFETCRRLQELPVPPSVLFLTAQDSVQHAVRGLDLGGMDYLNKPYDITHLKAKLRAALRVKRRLDLLAERVAVDPLTKLLSRGEIESRGRLMIAQAERHDRPLGCLVVDIDHFKPINDKHGHGAGDQVLTELAHRLQEIVREGDLLFRMGGEEFLVLAPEADSEACLQLAERLRAVGEAQSFELEDTAGRQRIEHLTISVGAASWRTGITLDELIRSADAALYTSKGNGRNCTHVAHDDEPGHQSTPHARFKAAKRANESTNGADHDTPDR